MSPQNIRLRLAPLVALIGAMMLASFLAAAPAAAAKTRPFVSVFCQAFSGTGPATPGTVIQCQAWVSGSAGAPTGTLKVSASNYKGTLSTQVCGSLSFCVFTYTPKGKGSTHRQDTVTASYSGDATYYSARSSHKFPIVAPPPAEIDLTCPESVPSGTTATCSMSIFYPGGQPFSVYTTLSVPSYKGTVGPDQCGSFSTFCLFGYTPKGRGTTRRVDTITAKYPGDQRNSPATATVEVKVPAAP